MLAHKRDGTGADVCGQLYVHDFPWPPVPQAHHSRVSPKESPFCLQSNSIWQLSFMTVSSEIALFNFMRQLSVGTGVLHQETFSENGIILLPCSCSVYLSSIYIRIEQVTCIICLSCYEA